MKTRGCLSRDYTSETLKRELAFIKELSMTRVSEEYQTEGDDFTRLQTEETSCKPDELDEVRCKTTVEKEKYGHIVEPSASIGRVAYIKQN